MKDLTVIVPVYKYEEDLLKQSVESFENADANKDTELLFVGPKDVLDNVKKLFNEKRYTFLGNDNSGFCAQINKAVEKCRKYFSILEYDDVYTRNWFKNVEKYMNTPTNISLYLPLTEIVLWGKESEGSVGYVNEAVLSTAFSEELGYLDLESALEYGNFNLTGGVFKTEDFISVGKLKEPIKLSFWYEFLLRFLKNDKRVFVIPKVGYIHVLRRPSSLSETYNQNMKPEEAEFWYDLAKKDYLFKNTRDLSHYVYE